MNKVCKAKSVDSIRREWDAIAEKRSEQISSHKDLSYEHILIPTVLKIASNSNLSSVIDIGCGVGFVTKAVSPIATSLLAIDMSSKCIQLAQQNCAKQDNVQFENMTIEEYSAGIENPCFTLAIANMTLMTTLDIYTFLQSARRTLVSGAKLVATITHPCFWPAYWGYSSATWFDYTEEIIIEAPFRISQESTAYNTTHVHRPLQHYFSAFKKSNFNVEYFSEPMPDERIRQEHPGVWAFPRFAAFECTAE